MVQKYGNYGGAALSLLSYNTIVKNCVNFEKTKPYELMKQIFRMQLFSVVLTALLWLSGLPLATAQQSLLNQTFTPMELKEDWRALRSWMENHHPNLYVYTSKSVLDSVFDAVNASLTQQMTVDQFYNRISTIQPYVKDGHNILLPSEKYQAYCNQHALYFPLTVAWLEGNMVVTQNQSDEPTLTPGTILQELNGRPADALFDDMVGRLMRDGDNLRYPEYLAQNYFRTFYGFFFGFSKTHDLTVKLPDGTVRELRLKATHRMVITTREVETGSGVQPDLVFKTTPKHVINNTDLLMEDVF